MSGMSPAGSQYERTRLAWRRAMLAILVVGGLGGVHLAIAGYWRDAGLVTALTIGGLVPAVHRLVLLRREVAVPTWHPVVLTSVACLMAMVVFVPD